MNPDEKSRIVVTIDGPAGAGKSTVARRAAEILGLPYLDTGAIYRAAAWRLFGLGIPPREEGDFASALDSISISFEPQGRVFINGEDITTAIRTPETDSIVSAYSALGSLRKALLPIQRAQAENGLVADGRDMGTVVFPDAELKIFLTASAEERAGRRFRERLARGENAVFDEILRQVNERDAFDMNREISPLRPAQGAIILDSTHMTFEEVVAAIVSLAREMEAQTEAQKKH